ncbi:hypothetical protein cd3_103 [Carnobacterium phage cd3]|nr:hypothetical protein cd3_103 [Carnobacterium phage cd3]
MEIFKNKEKLYRLEVEGDFIDSEMGGLTLDKLVLEAYKHDQELPISKLVEAIGLGTLEMKFEEYTDLKADNMEQGHSLAIANTHIEWLKCQILELSRECEAEANFKAFEAYNEHRESSYEYFKEAMEKLIATVDLESGVPNEPANVEFVGDLLDRIDEAERKADEEYFKSMRSDKVIVVNAGDVFYKQVKELKLESLTFKIQNLYKRFEEARKLADFELSLCSASKASVEAEEAFSEFYSIGHELHDLLCKELRDKREDCLKCNDRGLTGTDVEKLLKVQYEALKDLLKVVKKHVYP